MTSKEIINKIKSVPDGVSDYGDCFLFLSDLEIAIDPSIWIEIFGIFERNPLADFGAPGIAVHFIERFFPDYIHDLIDSLNRSPSMAGFWMLNRILNAKLDKETKNLLLISMKNVLTRSDVDPKIQCRAQSFLKLQMN